MGESSRTQLFGVDTRPLRQQIADALQRAIIEGELKPGDALIETDIATRLGVSRAPVREALQLLATSRLVEVFPYKGTTVRALTATDVAEAHTMRLLLEAYAIRQLAERRGGGVLDALRDACREMASLATGNDERALLDADERFHHLVIEGADNELLASVWSSIHMRVRQIIALRNRRIVDPTAIARNHEEIVAAIAVGDADTAERLLRTHLDRTTVEESGNLVAT